MADPTSHRSGSRDLAKAADARAVGQPRETAQSLQFFAMLWRMKARLAALLGRRGV